MAHFFNDAIGIIDTKKLIAVKLTEERAGSQVHFLALEAYSGEVKIVH